MRIGFDAKRFFHNNTGLGNYSRTLLQGLVQYYPGHQYILFNPKQPAAFAAPDHASVTEVGPQTVLARQLPAIWRSKWVIHDLKKQGIDLFHGLSHELPLGIANAGITSVVTVHDLIFERYPAQYGRYEVGMHRYKIQQACRQANAVIAASSQTKTDLIERYGVPEQKITVCYQSCHPAFAQTADVALQQAIKKAYALPDDFFLYVGSVIERKNLLRICEAMVMAQKALQLPLVVVGTGKAYQQKVLSFLQQSGLKNRVHFLAHCTKVPPSLNIHQPQNLSALYQLATALIYPSQFEGFGIPVLEAMWSGVPVITSNQSSMPEIGGEAVAYVDPLRSEDICNAMLRLQNSPALRQQLAAKGRERAKAFSLQQCTDAVMNLYQNTLDAAKL